MYAEVLEFVSRHERFLIAGHQRPDGDCLGTESALYHFLKASGKEAVVLNADPLPPSYDFLGEHTPFAVHRRGEPLPDFDVLCLVDCSSLSRLGSVGEAAREAGGKPVLVVDHHLGAGDGDGDVLLWDQSAPSAGVLVLELFRAAGLEPPLPAAEAVFVSLAADTGWFRYSNTDGRVLDIAARLVARGLEPHRIYDRLHRRRDPAALGLLAEAVGGAEFALGGRVALVRLPKSFVRRADGADFDTDEILDQLRSIRGVEIVVLLKELLDGRVKLSLRANGSAVVHRIAASFGGGGHAKAAGAELSGPLDEAAAKALEAVRADLEG